MPLWNLRHRLRLRLGAVLALLLVAGPALAVVPSDHGHEYEIPLASYDLHNFKTASVVADRAAVEQELARSLDGAWKIYAWNPPSKTPRWVYGSGIPVPGSVATATDAVAAARDFVRSHPGIFRAEPASLRFHSAPRGAGKVAVHFQQTYQMLDVWGGRVSLIFTEEGRLFVFGSTVYPDIELDVRPSLDAATAVELARADLPFDPATDSIGEEPRLLVLPVPLSETEVEHHLAWRVEVRTEDPVGLWVTHVDAHTGRILWRYNDVHFIDYSGDTSGLVQRSTYCDGQQLETMPYLRVQISGLGPVYANGQGNWTVANGDATPRSITADLYSPYVDLYNFGGAQGAFNGTATPGVPLTIAYTDVNAQRDEKDVYRAVNDLHDFIEQVDPGYVYTNQRITANVSRNSTCNAYYVSNTINFYRSGGGCANTGEIMDVVHHEYGHGVQENLLGWQGDQGLGEGNSDIMGNLMVLSPIVGRGFYLNNCTEGIRNSDNTLQYPGDVIGQPIHSAGRVIAGFNWDALQELIPVHGVEEARLIAARAWHFGRKLQQPTTQPDQVLATFMADDNDGDLTNGTPHYDAFCVGAANHGFDCPEILSGVIISHTPLASRETEGPAVVPALIYSTEGGLVADSVRVVYRVNGGPFQAVVMQPSGGLNEYEGVIPALTSPSEVEYYLRARDAVGNVRTSPSAAPAALHAFDVATEYDPQEAESGWTVNLEGSDNASTGQWVRVDPNGTSAQPEFDYTPEPGVLCWVTGDAPPGSGDGAADIDGGTTTLYSPVYDLTGAIEADVKYFRWYSNDKGATPGTDTWVVEVRNNGGPWVQVESTQQSSNAWVLRTFDLVQAFGAAIGSVQFRFVGSDLGDGSLVEAAVDDFVILAQLSAAGVPTPAPAVARFALNGGQPNPLMGAGRISFNVPARSQVDLAIFDVSGRMVRALPSGIYEAGSHGVVWDGRDGEGRDVSSGVYYVRMQADGFRATRSLVLSR